MKDWTLWVVVIAILAGSAIISIALAAVGEPQSAWFWCEVIGMEVCG